MAGMVTVDGRPEEKPGKAFPPDCMLQVREGLRYVGRGGEKIAAALATLHVAVAGRKCLDIGASTGGFTDCLLQAGAEAVIALDVGRGQLAQKISDDPRVTVLDRVNARYLRKGDLPYVPELVTIDVSFISLDRIMPAVARLVGPGAAIVALVKPQFEAGRAEVRRGGVVKDAVVHAKVLGRVCEMCEQLGFFISGIMESPLRGPAGNKEFFIYLTRT
jgi:23S rRNA (cytidine1920-2'-O)/16S rRNA (cytidine1409-2'-O)-methyltransferase